MALTEEQVRQVAALARLSLTDEEVRRLSAELSHILDAMELLRQLDTTGVEPTSHATAAVSALRPDEVVPALSVEQALAGAPAKVGTSFAVPKIIE